MVRAASRMPKLKRFNLKAHLDSEWDMDSERGNIFEVEYAAPGEHHSCSWEGSYELGKHKLLWIPNNWRPNRELLSLWENIVPSGERPLLLNCVPPDLSKVAPNRLA
jgi:hypothetical protein